MSRPSSKPVEAAAPKVPFYKKEFSLKRGPSQPKQKKEPKPKKERKPKAKRNSGKRRSLRSPLRRPVVDRRL